MGLQERRDSEGGEGRNEGISGGLDIAAIDDGADDAGVGTGATDAFAFERFDERGFGIAGGGLGFMADRI